MKHETFTLTAHDGLELFAQQWYPDTDYKGLVCLVHGKGSHSSRYAHVAQHFARNEYSLFAIDLRGHGKSKGKRGHITQYSDFMNDVTHFLDVARARAGGTAHFLYGHSMGGNIALNYVLRKKPSLNGVIATSPWLALAFKPPWIKRAASKVLNRMWPSVQLSAGINTEYISRDPSIVQAYDIDSLISDKITPRLYASITDAAEYARAMATTFPAPLLLMHGTGDKITCHQTTKKFAHKSGAELKLWDGLYHELHNEPEKKQVLDTMVAFLDKHL